MGARVGTSVTGGGDDDDDSYHDDSIWAAVFSYVRLLAYYTIFCFSLPHFLYKHSGTNDIFSTNEILKRIKFKLEKNHAMKNCWIEK